MHNASIIYIIEEEDLEGDSLYDSHGQLTVFIWMENFQSTFTNYFSNKLDNWFNESSVKGFILFVPTTWDGVYNMVTE